MKHWMLWTAISGFVAVAVVGTVSGRVRVRGRRVSGSIVSLAPNVTEIVFGLGLEHRLLGISTACDYPPETRSIRKAGDFGSPDIELLYALKPELVITTSLRDLEAADAIRRSGARLLVVKQRSIKEVLAAVEEIGRAAGVPEAARRYTDRLKRRIANATVSVPDGRRPRVFVELSGQPLRTAAKGSFLDDLIHRAGGRNIAHDLGAPWITISADTVVASNPEIIIVAHPTGVDAHDAIAGRIGWAGVDAVKSGRVVSDLNPDLVLRPGPRLVDGLEALAALFRRYREERAQ